MAKRVIEWAAREKRRSVNLAVGRNFLKTMTEPITNSDSALKTQAGVPHASGLVERMLRLEKGDRIDSSELKKDIPRVAKRRILARLATAGERGRQCTVIDNGPGMSRQELDAKFSKYASAKALGQSTRSLFGRGALDVLLYHDNAVIHSVKNGRLSCCKIYWETDATAEADDLGPVSKGLLESVNAPRELLSGGTAVQFTIKEGTPIPQEDQIIKRLSAFYMLRLIAADPNTEVTLERTRADGKHSNVLSYDFPIGEVLGNFRYALSVDEGDQLDIHVFVARSNVILEGDPDNIDRRENGLLFVDENDAVLDLTLLPDFERNPYLRHLFGVVRLNGIRSVLEKRLEAPEPVAVLTATRDGFDRRNSLTQRIFASISERVKPLYAEEELRQKKGDTRRSNQLDRRVKDVLKLINQFNKEETGEGDGVPPPPPPPREPIYFSINSTRLHTGITKVVSAFVDLSFVRSGEVVLFESDNPAITVQPDSDVVHLDKGSGLQRSELHVNCNVKGQKGTITALTLGKDDQELRAALKVLGVDDPPVAQPPADIAFTSRYASGMPNKLNNVALLVNLDAFPGKPEIIFWLEEKVGSISLAGGPDRIALKVGAQHLITGTNLARVVVSFQGTGWGQTAAR